jgi:diguanylate cyclase (GGDEF)-like protein
MTHGSPRPAPVRRPSWVRPVIVAISLLSGLAAAAALVAGHLAGGLAALGGSPEPSGLRGLAGLLAVAAAACLVAQGALGVALRRRLEDAEARATAGAGTDDLTGAANRRQVLERLSDELGRARRYRRALSVALLDVDGLARVNAAVGTDGGDAVLRAVAGAVRAELRRSDVVGRLRDDELLVVLPETEGAGARVIAERLREAVGRLRVLHAGIALQATASLGVATAAPDSDGVADAAEALLRRADEALFQAKSEGRDRVAVARQAGSALTIQPPPSSTSPS